MVGNKSECWPVITFSAEVKGLKELEQSLRAMGAEMGAKTLRSALRDIAKPVAETMRQKAPVSVRTRYINKKSGKRVLLEPGFLASRIKVRTALSYNVKTGKARKGFGKNTVAKVRVGVFKVPYVGHVEFGTSSAAAQPFLQPSIDAHKFTLPNEFKARLQHRVKLAQRKIARRNVKK